VVLLRFPFAANIRRSDGARLAKLPKETFELATISLRTLTSGPPLHRLRILIVENHEDTLTYLTRYLRQLGHEVCAVNDMASALKAASSSSFDVLISDIGLPDGDGWQLISQMKAKPFGIAMSGFGASSDREKSHAAGYKHHLIKPFLPDDLDALLEEAASQITERT
jgi:CheY-like chemotaxis protein